MPAPRSLLPDQVLLPDVGGCRWRGLIPYRIEIALSALPVGFFGVLFGLRFNVSSEVVGTTLIASTVLSAATLAAIYFTAGMGQP
jgi:hypothetical protein